MLKLPSQFLSTGFGGIQQSFSPTWYQTRVRVSLLPPSSNPPPSPLPWSSAGRRPPLPSLLLPFPPLPCSSSRAPAPAATTAVAGQLRVWTAVTAADTVDPAVGGLDLPAAVPDLAAALSATPVVTHPAAAAAAIARAAAAGPVAAQAAAAAVAPALAAQATTATTTGPVGA
ncbi:hypothetical protein PR202_gb26195 [Eleusine coracana subsp. coracana]|uniref:Uncharacterized protein n=1 Tax=Eleusine coracana subsp. coracana TaxID=191504 RepID=A0AAV5FQX7_ELECO|nr:hypothetical protein PR202_gb26195 [Eleusine coracana subsp. coracana]